MDSTDIFNDLYKAEESPQPSDKEGESIDLNQQSNSAKEWIYAIMFRYSWFLGFFVEYESDRLSLWNDWLIDWEIIWHPC